jgi:hypothetical protein
LVEEAASMRSIHRLLHFVAALVALAWCCAPSPAEAQQCDRHCGTLRWAVKTLTDSEAGQVDTTPQAATVEQLRALVRPRRTGHRLPPVELTTYRVDALLLGWMREADEDFHLVIADPRDPRKTMIAEIPSPTCPEVCRSAVGGRFAALRQQLIDRLGAPSSHYRPLEAPVAVEVTGVGFFDFLHGEKGQAPNAIELHPVKAIRFP